MKIGTFIKKPIPIHGVQWDGRKETVDYIRIVWNGSVVVEENGDLLINTLDGWMRCKKGDWIMRGVDGELYPIKNTILKKSYDVVSIEETRREEL